tara:strand:- start:278 stop:421 length:144 start_codon:yes stop_codon:yes gene_type:complete
MKNILILVNVMENIAATDEQISLSDINSDGIINILDVMSLVNLILSN